jgi:hypothetical protein
MNVINLDKFRRVQKVTLGGKEYEVYGLSVDDYLNKGVIENIDKAKTDADRVTAMLEVLKQFTNIPPNILLKQEFPVWTALILVIQGIDPNEAEKEPEKKEGKAKAAKK